MKAVTKSPKRARKQDCCSPKPARAKRRPPVIAQCCSKRSRIVAGCHDAL